MKEILPNYFSIKVPEDAHNFMLFSENEDGVNLCFATGDGISASFLPPGSYTFLFCSNDVTEEQAAGVVPGPMLLDDQLEVWNDYTDVMDLGFDTAIESFHSLLRSHNLTGNYAIIKK